MDGDNEISLKISAPLLPFSHASDAPEGARQMINVPRSCGTSTQGLIKLRRSVRGQVVSHSASLLWIPKAPLPSRRGHPSLLWLTLFDNHCLHSHQQQRISLKGLYALVLNTPPSSVRTMWGAWELKGNRMTTQMVFVLIRVLKFSRFWLELEIKMLFRMTLGYRIQNK